MNSHNENNRASRSHSVSGDRAEVDYSHQEWPRDFDFRQSRSEQQELLPPQQRSLPGMRWQRRIDRL